MRRVLDGVQKRFIDLIEKIEGALLVRVIRAGLVNMVPVLTVGAFALALYAFPNEAYITFIKTFAGGFLYQFFHAVYMGTFGLLSVYMAVSFSYSYCSLKNPEKKTDIWCILTALVAFLIMDGITSEGFDFSTLGAVSVFVAMVTSIAASALYLAVYRRISVRRESFSYGADSRLNHTLIAILPTAVIIILASFLTFLVTLTGKANFNELISDFLNNLFLRGSSSFGRGLAFVLLSGFLWFFGIHGGNCLQGVSDTLFVPLLEQNIEAVAAGGQATDILCKPFFDCFILMGGCGSSICLLLAILLFSKDRSMRDIAKTSAFHMVFNINELMVFGLPIVFNPVILIPFITVPAVQYLISYAATSLGLVPVITSAVEWSTPILIGGYVATGSVAGSLLQLFNLLVGTAIYAPFVYMMGHLRQARNLSYYQSFAGYYAANEERLQAVRLSEMSGDFGRVAKALILDLKRAIASEEYSLFYQPQYNYDGRCIGVEALLRWKHPVYGLIPPPLTIRLAREGEMLEAFEQDILKKALCDREKLYARFGDGIKLSVNVSGYTIASDTYWAYLKTLCEEKALLPGQLCIEVTERAAVAFDSRLLGHFREMKAYGIGFAIDDFSAGQTSIHYLKEEIFDLIKLDGSLVRGMATNPRCSEIIASIVQLAGSLDISVLAEFVETEELKERLHQVGCDNYQGYLFSPPVEL